MQLKLLDATKRFGDRTVLSGFSATFKVGSLTALTGPSGSGKSTVLGILSGLIPLDSGEVQISDGADFFDPEPNMVAWVPQGTNALPGRTVIDNVAIGPLSCGMGRAQALGLCHATLQKVGLSHLEGQLARNLSGGELQRVSLARAMASGKPFIFADEPSSSLDLESTRILADLLASLTFRATVIVATHDNVLVDAASEVVRMRREIP